MAKVPIEVLMVPDYRTANPYQALLAKSLAESEFTPTFSEWSSIFNRIFTPPPVIHIHWLEPIFQGRSCLGSLCRLGSAVVALLYFRFRRTKIVWTVHNLQPHNRKNLILGRWANRLVARLASKIILLKEERTEVEAIWNWVDKAKIRCIYHGNFIGAYPDNKDRTTCRALLNLSKNDRVFLFFGKIRPYKGLENLILAFEKLESENVILLIAGEGEPSYLNNLKTKIKMTNRIFLHSKFIADEEVQIYFHSADAVVLPYLDILNSGSIWLAMSFAQACITPRLGSAVEFLNSSNSFVYDSTEPDGLLKVLKEVVKDFDEARARGRRAFETVSFYNWNEIGRRTADVYRQVIQDHPVKIDDPRPRM